MDGIVVELMAISPFADRISCSYSLGAMTSSQHVYEVRPRQDHRGVDLSSDALPFARLWYTKPDDAVDYATFFSRSHHAVIRVYDDAAT